MFAKELHNALLNLKKKKIILYPTDTVWGLGCDATSYSAVQKIYKIKEREESKSLIILVDSVEMLQKYIKDIPKKGIEILEQTTKPTTIIYENPKGLAKNMVADDNTIAVRIVQHPFCKQLINKFGKPIVSTSANISGKKTPKSYKEISNTILMNVDYIVNLQQEEITNRPSRILKIDGNNVVLIRE